MIDYLTIPSNFLMNNKRTNYFALQVVAAKFIPDNDKGSINQYLTSSYQRIQENLIKGNIQTTEVECFIFKTKPHLISYNYQSNTQFIRRRHGYFIDEPGMIATQININGQSGVDPRQYGAIKLDGFTRLKLLRERVFKLSHAIDKETQTQILFNDKASSKTTSYAESRGIIGDDIVYLVNWYDFWNDEKFCVEFSQLGIQSDSKNGQNSNYNVTLHVLGEPIQTFTENIYLLKFQTLDWLQDKVEQAVDEANLGAWQIKEVLLDDAINFYKKGTQHLDKIIRNFKGVNLNQTLTKS